jgi:hypothetical protein
MGISGNFTTLPLPFLDVNYVIDITDNNLNLNQTRMLIQSYNLALTVGSQMSISTVNVNELSFSNV